MTSLVRPLLEEELGEADGIYRRAFGTFLSLPDPLSFDGDAQVLKCRWTADPDAAVALLSDGALAGSNFVTRWGSVGLFGPLTVDPPRQGRGLAHPLVEAALRLLEAPQVAFRGLFTFAGSPKHVALYQRFGYWPASLAAMMSRPVTGGAGTPEGVEFLSRLSPDEQAEALSACRELTDSVFSGLDVMGEILSVGEQETGETVFVRDGSRLSGLAVCQTGAGSEAGSGRAAVKFAAVRSGSGGGQRLGRLLNAVEAWAASAGASVVVAGTGSGRVGAWETLRAAGYRPYLQGLTMHRERHPGYDREDVFVLDDWR
ncbi:MAG: GNAT family N-acetyltransferase [Holophagales bacterium]|jgi:GNAT superfamily N-acetyltransferase|nr:GNAT family N-acetyltransferase [Holophagales bacterium]